MLKINVGQEVRNMLQKDLRTVHTVNKNLQKSCFINLAVLIKILCVIQVIKILAFLFFIYFCIKCCLQCIVCIRWSLKMIANIQYEQWNDLGSDSHNLYQYSNHVDILLYYICGLNYATLEGLWVKMHYSTKLIGKIVLL
jgi:hypothetical protein